MATTATSSVGEWLQTLTRKRSNASNADSASGSGSSRTSGPEMAGDAPGSDGGSYRPSSSIGSLEGSRRGRPVGWKPFAQHRLSNMIDDLIQQSPSQSSALAEASSIDSEPIPTPLPLPQSRSVGTLARPTGSPVPTPLPGALRRARSFFDRRPTPPPRHAIELEDHDASLNTARAPDSDDVVHVHRINQGFTYVTSAKQVRIIWSRDLPPPLDVADLVGVVG